MATLDPDLIFRVSILILILYMSLRYILKAEESEKKAKKKRPKVKSKVEKEKPTLEGTSSKTRLTDVEIPLPGKKSIRKVKEASVEEVEHAEEIIADVEPVLGETEIVEEEAEHADKETMEQKEAVLEDDLITEKEPVQMADKPVLYVKKVIPEFTLKSQTHSLELSNKIILKNLSSALVMKLKGSIEYKLKDEPLANESIGSNMPLGPNQTITIENSFQLPLNEIQYIKVANIIKNKQSLDVRDVKPVMKLDIQYEGENGEVSDIVQNYQLDFKNQSWGLYIK